MPAKYVQMLEYEIYFDEEQNKILHIPGNRSKLSHAIQEDFPNSTLTIYLKKDEEGSNSFLVIPAEEVAAGVFANIQAAIENWFALQGT